MKRFVNLLKLHEAGGAEEAQRAAQREFPELVREHGFRFQERPEPISANRDTIIIGIACGYSVSDLLLLDEIAAMNQSTDLDVRIFDASKIQSMDDFRRFVPGLGPVHQTPVVGFWRNGRMELQKTGKEARDFIRRRFNRGI